jgi:hypothetical protein
MTDSRTGCAGLAGTQPVRFIHVFRTLFEPAGKSLADTQSCCQNRWAK